MVVGIYIFHPCVSPLHELEVSLHKVIQEFLIPKLSQILVSQSYSGAGGYISYVDGCWILS